MLAHQPLVGREAEAAGRRAAVDGDHLARDEGCVVRSQEGRGRDLLAAAGPLGAWSTRSRRASLGSRIGDDLLEQRVMIAPGATALARMPTGPYSTAV
jgi:hypothetical protein